MAVEIVLAAFVADGRILLAHRHPDRRWYPDCWDLLGGHLEEGESPGEALRRECREELAVEVVTMRALEVELADPGLRPHAFLVTQWRGVPVNAAPEEHDDLRWFGAADLPRLTLAHPAYATWLPALLR